MGDIVPVPPRHGLHGSAFVAIADGRHRGVRSGRRRPTTLRALIALVAAAIALLLLTTTASAGCDAGGCPGAQVTVIITVRVAVAEPVDAGAGLTVSTASITTNRGVAVGAAPTLHPPGVAPVPPPGGLTSVVAGTSDIVRLVEAQQFAVATVWIFDVASQRLLVYVVGAPDFASTLTGLTANAIVTFRAR